MWVFSIFVILLHEPIFYLDELERNFLVLATKFIEKFFFAIVIGIRVYIGERFG